MCVCLRYAVFYPETQEPLSWKSPELGNWRVSVLHWGDRVLERVKSESNMVVHSLHCGNKMDLSGECLCGLIYPELIRMHDAVQLTPLSTSCLVAAGALLCWRLPSGSQSSGFHRFSKVDLGRGGFRKGSSLLGTNSCFCRCGAVRGITNFWNLGNLEVISVSLCACVFFYIIFFFFGGRDKIVLNMNLLFPKEASFFFF